MTSAKPRGATPRSVVKAVALGAAAGLLGAGLLYAVACQFWVEPLAAVLTSPAGAAPAELEVYAFDRKVYTRRAATRDDLAVEFYAVAAAIPLAGVVFGGAMGYVLARRARRREGTKSAESGSVPHPARTSIS